MDAHTLVHLQISHSLVFLNRLSVVGKTTTRKQTDREEGMDPQIPLGINRYHFKSSDRNYSSTCKYSQSLTGFPKIERVL